MRHYTKPKVLTAAHLPMSINVRTKSSDMDTSPSPTPITMRGLTQLTTPGAGQGKQTLNPSKNSSHPFK